MEQIYGGCRTVGDYPGIGSKSTVWISIRGREWKLFHPTARIVHQTRAIYLCMVVLTALLLSRTVRAVEEDHYSETIVEDGIRILSPSNDSVLYAGKVVVYVETSGFAASVDTPIEVRVPQNGPYPTFLQDDRNILTLTLHEPCTQLVTFEATVNGRRFSTAVLFSVVLRKSQLVSRRAPLPADASWGISNTSGFRKTRSGSDGTFVEASSAFHGPSKKWSEDKQITTAAEADAMHRYYQRQHLDEADVVKSSNGAMHLSEKDEVSPTSHGAEMVRWEAGDRQRPSQPKEPLSLLFIGSFAFDGQKTVWLHQMEELPRQLFSPTFLTFERDEGQHDTTVRHTHSSDKMEERLLRANVPVVKVAAPRLNLDDSEVDGLLNTKGSDDYDEYLVEEGADRSVEEVLLSAVLKSFDKAEGQPSCMKPSWTRGVFEHLGNAVAGISPDVLVLGNTKSLGDAVLTRAAQWAMGQRGRIVLDFPNIGPAPGIVAHVLAAPSHYAARHPTTQALAASAGARVVVIPPGVKLSGIRDRSSRSWVSENGTRGSYVEERSICKSVCGGAIGGGRSECDSRCKVVGFVGRLAPEKAPGLFLSVCAQLARLMPSARFVVVGDGPLRPALEGMASRLEIASLTDFVGWKDGDQVQRILTDVDLLFNPSLALETFAIANIEAMAAGTPVASFGIGGMLEHLVPGVNSLLLEDPDPGAVAAVLAEILSDPKRLEQMGLRGREDVTEKFPVQTAVRRWAALYEALREDE